MASQPTPNRPTPEIIPYEGLVNHALVSLNKAANKNPYFPGGYVREEVDQP